MTDPRSSELSGTDLTRADAPAPARRAPLEAGAEYAGRYRVIELLGRGGMGEVYRVHETVLGVSVALSASSAGPRAIVSR